MAGMLPLEAGRSAFGDDPAGYDSSRPPYPDALFAMLRDRCGLRPGAAVFEIGAGTGTATRALLAAGPSSLAAIEPDARLAGFLAASVRSPSLSIRIEPFESAALPEAGFDLGIAATALHWLEPRAALAKAHRSLRPGGWFAMFWNVFGDPDRPDAFARATAHIDWDAPRSPSAGGDGRPPFALDAERRLADLLEAGFGDVETEQWRWTIGYPTARLLDLYRSFSPIRAAVQ